MTTKKDSSNTADTAPTTARLLRMLETSPRRFQEQQLAEKNDPSFHAYLNKLMEEYQYYAPDLVVGACISKTYVYQFINGDRLPGRDIILRIALAMGLTLDETQRLLTLAGKSVLYPRIRRDASILYCIRKKMSLDESNSFLEDLGEETLL
ncbi:MAG: hypothetical protein J1F18_03785 [Lachnospiraceae bacterium]|nr:hypothetical protein [Lachnospiraceae bacterium]